VLTVITHVRRSATFTETDDTTDTATGEYITVSVTISNTGDKPAEISYQDFHLKCGSKEYDPDQASMSSDHQLFLTPLNPGLSKSGTIVFDVPADTSPSKYTLEVYGNGAEGSQKSTEIQL
jgi:hypothetical protein